MSDHTIVIIWGHEDLFLYSSSLYSCHLFLISSASVRSIPFLSFIVLFFAWNFPFVISNFLEEISSVSDPIVFLYFFALITEEGFLISPCYFLELCIQMGISFLFSFGFHFSSFRDSLVAQTVKRLPAMRETWVHCPGREDPLEKEMATHSSTLA